MWVCANLLSFPFLCGYILWNGILCGNANYTANNLCTWCRLLSYTYRALRKEHLPQYGLLCSCFVHYCDECIVLFHWAQQKYLLWVLSISEWDNENFPYKYVKLQLLFLVKASWVGIDCAWIDSFFHSFACCGLLSFNCLLFRVFLVLSNLVVFVWKITFRRSICQTKYF